MAFTFKLPSQELFLPMQWTSLGGAVNQNNLCYQYYAGDFHQFLVSVAHGLTLLASSMAPCWADRDSWEEWLFVELRHRYFALCGLSVHLHEVHASINDLDACYNPGRTVLYVRVRVDGFFDEEAVWSPAMITCPALVEQLGLFVACQQRSHCRCYLNGSLFFFIA